MASTVATDLQASDMSLLCHLDGVSTWCDCVVGRHLVSCSILISAFYKIYKEYKSLNQTEQKEIDKPFIILTPNPCATRKVHVATVTDSFSLTGPV